MGAHEARRRYIYLVLNEESNAVKIGISETPLNRFRQLQSANAAPLVLLATIEGCDALEKDLQEAFGDERIRGEWFNFNFDMLLAAMNMATLQTMKNMAQHIMHQVKRRDWCEAEAITGKLIANHDMAINSWVRYLLSRKQGQNCQVSLVNLESIEERATDEVGTLTLT